LTNDLATRGKLDTLEGQSHLQTSGDMGAQSRLPLTDAAIAKPVEHVDSGIVPLADFIPKDAQNQSHPTPPPDEPLTTGSADIDVKMLNSEDAARLPASSDGMMPTPSIATGAESSLVRPREDDGEDEPSAKRSRLEEGAAEDLPVSGVADVTVTEQRTEAASAPVSELATEPLAEPLLGESREMEMPLVDAPAAAVLDAVVDATAEPVNEAPVNVAVQDGVKPVEDLSAAPVFEPASTISETMVRSANGDVKVEDAQGMEQPLEPDGQAMPTEQAAPVTETASAEAAVDAKAAAPTTIPTAAPGAPSYSTSPMTSVQREFLLKKTKDLKKAKYALAFLRPVDHVALNIPNYPEIIKEPMDLSTMEMKLKDGKHGSVQDFANDFHLIVNNTRRFNGDQHAVTQAGLSMEAYFNKMMQGVPSADEKSLPPKPERKRSPSISREKPKRESRVVVPPPTPAAPSVAPADVYALHADGTPQIRRQSSIGGNRPARAIKPPQNREIPYAKPKRKEHQLELRFCEYILDELRSVKYAPSNTVFMYPVDPVALNIPHYRQVVKSPMDLSTMSQKLKSGQYGTAIEFKKDFDLMIKNCLVFNPAGNPVRDLGIQFQRHFEELWSQKDKWERKNQPVSTHDSSASGEEDSGVDDEDPDDDDKAATILALQKQLADMQNALSGLHEKPANSKKSKSGSGSTKKSGSTKPSGSSKKAAPKPAPKPKKARVVSYEEKQEISEAVGKMSESQLNKVTELITTNDARYRDMDEMELEIDELSSEVQNLLLEYVRKTFGNPNKKKAREPSPDDAAALDDDDYEERGGARGGAGKRKKHRPMGKKEQNETIDSIKSRLAEFSNVQTSASASPVDSSFVTANPQAESSGDEESEESEEE